MLRWPAGHTGSDDECLERLTFAWGTGRGKRGLAHGLPETSHGDRPGGRVPVPVFRAAAAETGTGTSAALRSQSPFSPPLRGWRSQTPCAMRTFGALGLPARGTIVEHSRGNQLRPGRARRHATNVFRPAVRRHE